MSVRQRGKAQGGKDAEAPRPTAPAASDKTPKSDSGSAWNKPRDSAAPRTNATSSSSSSNGLSKAKLPTKTSVNIAALAARNLGGFVPNKIFVGGVPIQSTEEQFKAYFERFGAISKVELHALRGFGYITYESVESVDTCLEKYEEHYLCKKWVEVKRSIPRELIDSYEREQKRLEDEFKKGNSGDPDPGSPADDTPSKAEPVSSPSQHTGPTNAWGSASPTAWGSRQDSGGGGGTPVWGTPAPGTRGAGLSAARPTPEEPSGTAMVSQISQLKEMGFSEEVARRALSECVWDVNKAIDRLLTTSLAEDLSGGGGSPSTAEEPAEPPAAAPPPPPEPSETVVAAASPSLKESAWGAKPETAWAKTPDSVWAKPGASSPTAAKKAASAAQSPTAKAAKSAPMAAKARPAGAKAAPPTSQEPAATPAVVPAAATAAAHGAPGASDNTSQGGGSSGSSHVAAGYAAVAAGNTLPIAPSVTTITAPATVSGSESPAGTPKPEASPPPPPPPPSADLPSAEPPAPVSTAPIVESTVVGEDSFEPLSSTPAAVPKVELGVAATAALDESTVPANVTNANVASAAPAAADAAVVGGGSGGTAAAETTEGLAEAESAPVGMLPPRKKIERVARDWSAEDPSQLSVEEGEFVSIWLGTDTDHGWIHAEKTTIANDGVTSVGWLPVVVLQKLPETRRWMRTKQAWQAMGESQSNIEEGVCVVVWVDSRTAEGWTYIEASESSNMQPGWIPDFVLDWSED